MNKTYDVGLDHCIDWRGATRTLNRFKISLRVLCRHTSNSLSSGSISPTGLVPMTKPALLTKISTLPCAQSGNPLLKNASISLRFCMSSVAAWTFTFCCPTERHSSATLCNASNRLAVMITCAPREAKRCAVERPIPPDAPVISTTLSFKRFEKKDDVGFDGAVCAGGMLGLR